MWFPYDIILFQKLAYFLTKYTAGEMCIQLNFVTWDESTKKKFSYPYGKIFLSLFQCFFAIKIKPPMAMQVVIAGIQDIQS